MGLACRGLTHCSNCGKALQMGEYGRCISCREKEKKKRHKVYKGYELMKEIAEGNIKVGTKFIDNNKQKWKWNGTEFIYSERDYTDIVFILMDFELIEEDTIDIDSIEEIDCNGKTISSLKKEDEWIRCGNVNVDIFSQMKDNQNQLIKAVKQLNRKLKELKEK